MSPIDRALAELDRTVRFFKASPTSRAMLEVEAALAAYQYQFRRARVAEQNQ